MMNRLYGLAVCTIICITHTTLPIESIAIAGEKIPAIENNVTETKASPESRKKNTITEDEILDLELLAQAVEMLEKTVVRAPRPDSPTLADPSFPVTPFDSADIQLIKQCVCAIKQLLLNGVTVTGGGGGGNASGFGNGICFPDIITEATINATNQTITQWLGTIMKDIRGVCSTGS